MTTNVSTQDRQRDLLLCITHLLSLIIDCTKVPTPGIVFPSIIAKVIATVDLDIVKAYIKYCNHDINCKDRYGKSALMY